MCYCFLCIALAEQRLRFGWYCHYREHHSSKSVTQLTLLHQNWIRIYCAFTLCKVPIEDILEAVLGNTKSGTFDGKRLECSGSRRVCLSSLWRLCGTRKCRHWFDTNQYFLQSKKRIRALAVYKKLHSNCIVLELIIRQVFGIMPILLR